MPPHKAPDQAEQQQGQHGIAQAQMPVHPVAADIGGDDLSDDTDHQGPVKQAGGQVPDAYGVHGRTPDNGSTPIMETITRIRFPRNQSACAPLSAL
ncbi:hypothetical protein FQZ97_1047080 [compost metagenome]